MHGFGGAEFDGELRFAAGAVSKDAVAGARKELPHARRGAVERESQDQHRDQRRKGSVRRNLRLLPRERGCEGLMKHTKRLSLVPFLLLSMSCGAQKETLLIGPGDVLHFLVYDTPEMEQRARVTDGGTVPFNFLGSVKVEGLTPERAGTLIDQQLVAAGIMTHPQVTVRVEGYATQNVSVMGEVQKPGEYEIETSRKVV